MISRNVCYIGPRNSGKTTILGRICQQTLKEKVFLIVIDSVVEHKEKSLIKKLQKSGVSGNLIDWKNLFMLLKIKLPTPLFFNVSFFLERGHDVKLQILKRFLRSIYRLHVSLIIRALFRFFSKMKISFLLVIDETELNDTAKKILLALFSLSNVKVIIAVHNENYLGGEILSKTEKIFLTKTYQ